MGSIFLFSKWKIWFCVECICWLDDAIHLTDHPFFPLDYTMRTNPYKVIQRERQRQGHRDREQERNRT